VFENVTDDADISALLQRVGKEFDDAIAELTKNVAAAKYSGKIVEIRTFYNRDPADLSPSLQKFIKAQEKAAEERKKAAAGAPLDEPVRVNAPVRIHRDKVAGEVVDGVLITFLIQVEDVAGPGDKLVASSPLKGIISRVFEKGEEPTDETDHQVDYIMSPYDASFTGVNILFPKENVTNTLGEYLSAQGKRQLHTAETEKYAHVTFFFNGGRETPYEGEDRILVPSPKVATYDLKPEMSAYEVKDKLVGAINTQEYDFIVVNFANGDMVGHTGIYNAIAKAVHAIDNCVKDVVETAKANDYEVIIIADHGNADNAINEDEEIILKKVSIPNCLHCLRTYPICLKCVPTMPDILRLCRT
jgi:2,3-bisphosphoglycerate-independent phosphoglycerate mutase